MSRRDEQAAGYLLLLLIYVIYTIAIYVYDKFKIGYDFILTFYSQNSDTIFWLIIAIVAAFVWYLCGWLGSKKKNKLETTKVEPTAKPEIKSEPNLNPQKKYIPEMESASPLRHDPECEASYRIEDAISSPSIYRHAEVERYTPEIASSLKKVVEAA